MRTLQLVSLMLLLSSRIDSLDALSVGAPFLKKIASFPTRHPEILAVLVTSLKTGASDVIAQKLNAKRSNEGKKKLDKRRLASFLLYGGLYLGYFQYFLFAKVYSKWFPMAQVFATQSIREKMRDPIGALDVARQVTFEALVHWPWLYIPAFYVVQQTVAPKGFSLSSMIEKIRKNWKEDVRLCWKVWIPAAIFNFSSVPLNYQVPFVAFVSLFYMTFFSLRRGGGTAEDNIVKKDE